MDSGPVVGVVGCGRWGANVVRDLVALGAEVHVAAHHASARARAIELGARSARAELPELPDLDGVVVATPSSTHAAVTRAALERKVPVFVEKPFTTDVAAARSLVADAGERLFVMHKWRYHPGVELLAELQQSGALGAPIGLRTTRVAWRAIPDDVDAVWHLGPHDLSIAIALWGRIPTPVAAVAEVVDGVSQGLDALLRDELTHVFEVSFRRPRAERRIEVHGADAVAVLADGYADAVEIHRGEGAPELRAFDGPPPLERELAVFVAHVQGGPPPPTGAREALMVVEAIASLRALAGLEEGPC